MFAMRITRQNEGEMVVEDSGYWLSAILFVASLPLFYVATLHGKVGTVFGGAFFLLCSLLWLRKTVFCFNAAEGMVHWRRRRLLSVSTGDIPFSEIKGIGTETTSGSNNVTTYRLTILTAKGSVPLSDAYGGNHDKYASIRAELMRFLHLEAGEGVGADQEGSNAVGAGDLESIRSLLRQGRKIDAISLVRSGAKISLAEAVERVEEIDRSMKAAQ
jgi:hypothetical protein